MNSKAIEIGPYFQWHCMITTLTAHITSCLFFVSPPICVSACCHTGLFGTCMLNSRIYLFSIIVSFSEFLLFGLFLGLLVVSGANFAVGCEIAFRAAVGSESLWSVFSSYLPLMESCSHLRERCD